MLSQNAVVLFISLSSTYFFFMYTGGFTKVIQKCFHLKGTMNHLFNTYLFMVLVSVMIKTFGLYVKFFKKKTEEGFDEDSLAKKAMMTRVENLEKLVTRNYKKYDNMKEGKEKTALLNVIRDYQSKIKELNRKLVESR